MTYFEEIQKYHSWAIQRLSDSTFPHDVVNAEDREMLSFAVNSAKAAIHTHTDINLVYAKARQLLNEVGRSPLIEHMIQTGHRYRARIAKGHWQYGKNIEEACKLAISERKKQ